MFLIVVGQWSSVARRNKIYQALRHTQYMFIDQFTVVLGGMC